MTQRPTRYIFQTGLNSSLISGKHKTDRLCIRDSNRMSTLHPSQPEGVFNALRAIALGSGEREASGWHNRARHRKG